MLLGLWKPAGWLTRFQTAQQSYHSISLTEWLLSHQIDLIYCKMSNNDISVGFKSLDKVQAIKHFCVCFISAEPCRPVIKARSCDHTVIWLLITALPTYHHNVLTWKFKNKTKTKHGRDVIKRPKQTADQSVHRRRHLDKWWIQRSNRPKQVDNGVQELNHVAACSYPEAVCCQPLPL